ncbi:MAG TPA: hypothetical protein VFB16_02085 [Bauldia sp.]|nr:hypothetical protein [Bauldia sp.]
MRRAAATVLLLWACEPAVAALSASNFDDVRDGVIDELGLPEDTTVAIAGRTDPDYHHQDLDIVGTVTYFDENLHTTVTRPFKAHFHYKPHEGGFGLPSNTGRLLILDAEFTGDGGTNGNATNQSGDPATVGFLDDGNGGPFQAYLQVNDGPVVPLGALGGVDAQATASSIPTDVTDDGSVVVGFSDFPSDPTNDPDNLDMTHAFRWTASDTTIHDLGAPVGDSGYSRAFGLDATGNLVVGEAEFAGGRHAFLWSPDSGGTFTDLNTYSGAFAFNSIATAITGDGSVIAGQAGLGSNNSHAVLWTVADTTMHDLGVLAGDDNAVATGVSDNGKVAVGISADRPLTRFNPGWDYGDDTRAFRWSESTGMKDLTQLMTDAGVPMTGITFVAATGISRDGQFISGAAVTPDTPLNETEPFIVQYCDDDVEGPCFAGFATQGSVNGSLGDVAGEHSGITTHLTSTADLMLGFVDPLEGGSDAGAFAAAGSVTLGARGKYNLGDGFSLIGGAAYVEQSAGGASVSGAALIDAALRYVRPGDAGLRPFGEVAAWGSPSLDMHFTRRYLNGSAPAVGEGDASGAAAGLSLRAGMLYSPRPTDELVFSATLARNWLSVGAYSEALGPANPFPASFAAATDRTNLFKAGVAWTRKLSPKLDFTLSAAVGRSFGGAHDVSASITGFGGLTGSAGDYTFGEFGARAGWKVKGSLSLDAFLVSTTGPAIGTHTQVGGGLSIAF